MVKTNARCPVCGTVNYNLYLEETGGFMECECCKAVTCSEQDFEKLLPRIPVLKTGRLLERARIEVVQL